MAWDTAELLQRCGRPSNKEVLSYLMRAHPSAHSDLGQELMRAGDSLPDRHVFCPNPANCSYLLLHTSSGVIYALAVDMKTLLFLLPDYMIPKDVLGELKPYPQITPEWKAYEAFDANIPGIVMKSTISRLCDLAYRHALTL